MLYLFNTPQEDRTFKPVFGGGFLQSGAEGREYSLETGIVRIDILYTYEAYAYKGSRYWTDSSGSAILRRGWLTCKTSSSTGGTMNNAGELCTGISNRATEEASEKKLWGGSRYYWQYPDNDTDYYGNPYCWLCNGSQLHSMGHLGSMTRRSLLSNEHPQTGSR